MEIYLRNEQVLLKEQGLFALTYKIVIEGTFEPESIRFVRNVFNECITDRRIPSQNDFSYGEMPLNITRPKTFIRT